MRSVLRARLGVEALGDRVVPTVLSPLPDVGYSPAFATYGAPGGELETGEDVVTVGETGDEVTGDQSPDGPVRGVARPHEINNAPIRLSLYDPFFGIPDIRFSNYLPNDTSGMFNVTFKVVWNEVDQAGNLTGKQITTTIPFESRTTRTLGFDLTTYNASMAAEFVKTGIDAEYADGLVKLKGRVGRPVDGVPTFGVLESCTAEVQFAGGAGQSLNPRDVYAPWIAGPHANP